MKDLVPIERIEQRILLIRGQKVMLDRDLADLYGVTTRNLKRQVRRNLDRFPEEFMFQLKMKERDELVPNWHRFNSMKHSTSLPYAFTEHGIAMLSAVLKSKQAVKVSILIINTFMRLRQLLAGQKDLAQKFRQLEGKVDTHDTEIQAICKVIKQMLAAPDKPRRRIGFRP